MFRLEFDHTFEPRLRLHGIKLRRWFTRRGRGRQFDALLQPLDVDVETVESFTGVTPVHVAQRNDVLACEVDQIVAAHAADADCGDVEHVAWRSESTTEHVSRNNGTGGATSGHFSQEGGPRDFFLFAHEHLSWTGLSRVGEGDVRAEGDHAEAGSDALAAPETHTAFEFALSRSGKDD